MSTDPGKADRIHPPQTSCSGFRSPLLGLSLLLFAALLLPACSELPESLSNSDQPQERLAQQAYIGKKILYVNSYHQGLPWSDGIELSLKATLDAAGVEHQTIYLDSKRNRDQTHMDQAVAQAIQRIEAYQPDVLIVSDDNALNHIVRAHYRDTELPIVFCGVNWNIEKYDGPYTNTAGMVEVVLYGQSIKTVLPYAAGNTIGFLAEDTPSEYSNLENLTDYVGLDIVKARFVDNFSDWKKNYLEMQTSVDVLVVGVMGSFVDWSDSIQARAVIDFVAENTTIPTVTEHVWMVEFTLLAYGKLAEEQGEWAARAALQIMDGKTVQEIGVVKNRKGELAINSKLAEKLGIVFPAGVIKNARIFN